MNSVFAAPDFPVIYMLSRGQCFVRVSKSARYQDSSPDASFRRNLTARCSTVHARILSAYPMRHFGQSRTPAGIMFVEVQRPGQRRRLKPQTNLAAPEHAIQDHRPDPISPQMPKNARAYSNAVGVACLGLVVACVLKRLRRNSLRGGTDFGCKRTNHKPI
jgi:hypothetical protein